MPQQHKIALHIEAALFQSLCQGAGLRHGEFHVVEESAVHDDERVLDDVGHAVVPNIVERIGMAGATTETAPFGKTEGVVVGNAGLPPQIQRVRTSREMGTQVMLAGDADLLVAQFTEILFFLVEAIDVIR